MSYFEGVDIKNTIKQALVEDIGSADITTQRVIPQNKYARAVLLAQQDCVVCGLAVAAQVFKSLDKNIKFRPQVKDGDQVKKGKVLARLDGRASSILTAERVALNFLSLLSGISTKTRKFVTAIKPYKARIVDTRKTTPGLRVLEKYAVRIGGGFNHRFALDEMFLVKDNHISLLGGIDKISGLSRKYELEIEAKNLNELKQALRLKPDIIMLDNMTLNDMKKAVGMRDDFSAKTRNLKPKLEASGGINLNNIRQVASTGVVTSAAVSVTIFFGLPIFYSS